MQPQLLALALHGERGDILGGLIGELQWEWLRIDILAVAEPLRGQGWGRSLVEEAERIAASSGCHQAWVDTFSFQPPEFYKRLGHCVFGELPNYPSGQVRYFLAKVLTADPSRASAEPTHQPLKSRSPID